MIYHVFANRSNAGDWLSARGIQSLLAPLEVTEYLCDEPFIEEAIAALAAATERDFIVIGGGGLFMDYFTPFWEQFAEIAARVPFAIWGVGLIDLKREASRAPSALLESIVRRASVCVVRDELTRGYLSSCALAPSVPCPSLAAVELPSEPGWGLLYSDNYTTAGPDVSEALTDFGREFACQTGRPYRQTNNRFHSDSQRKLAETLALYASADLILSSRLHGCIIGLAMGRKVLAVSGDYKVEGFMEAAGLGDWVCDIRDVESVPERLRALAEQQHPAEFLARARQANREVAAEVRAAALRAGAGVGAAFRE